MLHYLALLLTLLMPGDEENSTELPVESQAQAETAAAPAASPAFQLMSEKRLKEYRSYLPVVDDAQVQARLHDPRLILYTRQEVPAAYQDWSNLLGIHSISYNVSAVRREPFGNGNREFPWNRAAGTHRTDGNVRSYHLLLLPENESGELHPIVWFRKRLRGDDRTGYGWRYPVGTMFGEVLQIRAPDQSWQTFELRLRTRRVDAWSVNVFRPFPSSAELVRRLRDLPAAWRERPSVTQLLKHLEAPAAMSRHTLVDPHPSSSFSQAMGVDRLPDVKDPELVTRLLQTPFQSALGATWRANSDGLRTAAPTTDARYHIVPARYDAGFIDVDRQSCMRCHETVNQNVRDFEPARDWYGRIRGSDGIFSFHPFALSSISHNGAPRSVMMRTELEQAGLLERYAPQKHPAQLYTSLPKLAE